MYVDSDLAQTVVAVVSVLTYLELRIARIVRQAAAEWAHTRRLDAKVEQLAAEVETNGGGDPREPRP